MATKSKGPWRFFYHYHRHSEKQMTVHFRDTCIPVDHVECYVHCQTKFSSRQPKVVMQGFAHSVRIEEGNGFKVAHIE